MIIVKVYREDQAAKVYRIKEFPCSLGRGPDNHISIEDDTVSGQHAEIVLKEDGLYLEDLQSTNGIYHEGEQKRRLLLENQNKIYLGTAYLEILKEDQSDWNEPTRVISKEDIYGTKEFLPKWLQYSSIVALALGCLVHHSVYSLSEGKDILIDFLMMGLMFGGLALLLGIAEKIFSKTFSFFFFWSAFCLSYFLMSLGQVAIDVLCYLLGLSAILFALFRFSVLAFFFTLILRKLSPFFANEKKALLWGGGLSLTLYLLFFLFASLSSPERNQMTYTGVLTYPFKDHRSRPPGTRILLDEMNKAFDQLQKMTEKERKKDRESDSSQKS